MTETIRLGLGRRYAPDERDGDYPLARAGPAAFPSRFLGSLGWRYWAPGPVLDQGVTSQCVAYSWKQYLQTSPIRQARSLREPFVYAEAQQRDEWPGEDYDGTSVRAGAKVLAEMGFIASYLWAQGAVEVRDWILQRGPVVVGTAWFESMFTPDDRGYLNIAGSLAGGHAYLVRGYSRFRNAFRCTNSWSEAWGQRGEFWLRYADLDWLIAQHGEACVAVERAV